MAKNDNVQDLLIDVANAIREKKGTTEKINPQNFSEEILSIQTGGASEELEGVTIPESFYGASNIYSFDMGDEILLSCDVDDTGLYKYSKATKETTLIYATGRMWQYFQMIEDYCFISSNDWNGKSNGLLCYDKLNNTVTIIHNETYGYYFKTIFEDKTCLVNVTGKGVWLFDYNTKTLTLTNLNKYANAFYQVGEDCLISSNQANFGSNGIYLYQNSTKTFKQVYYSGFNWVNFAKVGNNVVIGAGYQTTTNAGKGILLYDGITKTISTLLTTGQEFNYMLTYKNYVLISSNNSSFSGIYLYDDTDRSLTNLPVGNYKWDMIVKELGDKLLIGGTSSSSSGIVGVDLINKTGTKLYSQRYVWDKVVDLDNGDCLIASTREYRNGILYYNNTDFTITQLYTDGRWHNFHKTKDGYIITSNGDNSSFEAGVLYFDNIEKTIRALITYYLNWKLIANVGENCLVCTTSVVGVYLFNNSDKTFTQIYKYGYYNQYKYENDIVVLSNDEKKADTTFSYPIIFEYNIPNQEIQSIKLIME